MMLRLIHHLINHSLPMCGWLLLSTVAHAARFEHLSIAQGLSETTVYCAVQDQKGFLWFTTQDGLNRYDGYEFRVFRHQERDPESLLSSFLTSCLVDSAGFVWVGSQAGLDRFDPARFSARHYLHHAEDPKSLGDNRITALAEDHAGHLWVGTSNGLDSLDLKSGDIQHYRHQPGEAMSLVSDDISALYVDPQGTLWVGTAGEGLERFLPVSDGFVHLTAGEAGLVDNRVRKIAGDATGVLWVGSVTGLDRIAPGGSDVTHFTHDENDSLSLPRGAISALWVDDNSRLWVGTSGGGLSALTPGKPGFRRYQHAPGDLDSLSNDNVLSILRDRTGVLWVGSWGGVNKLVREASLFRHTRRSRDDPDQLSDNAVWSILQDHSGAVWVGTDVGGLNRIEPGGQHFTHYRHRAGVADSLSHDRVYALLEDHQGRLWVGTAGGLDRLRKGGGFEHFHHQSTQPDSLSNDSITALLEDAWQRLWVGTRNGLNRWLGKGQGFRKFMPGTTGGGLCNEKVNILYETAQGTLWVGTDEGLGRLEAGQARFRCYVHDPTDLNSLSGHLVLSIFQGKDGTLWVGTFDGGLNRLDRETGQFQHFTTADGLPNNVIYGILGDQFGLLWLSTNKGISMFNPRTGVFTNFDIKDGLQDYQFSQHAYFASPQGEFFFGGFNGFNRFFPADFMASESAVPKVLITGFRLFNERVPLARFDPKSPLALDLPYTESIVLADYHARFALEFSVMDFAAPDKNQYRYRLDGYDQQWSVVNARIRRATYTNLDPGSYTFRVQGANRNGIWSRQDALLRITLLPPYWRTTWAYLLYGLSLITVGWGFVHHHYRRLAGVRRAKRALEREVRVRTEDLRNKNRELETLDGIVRTINRAVDLHQLPGILLDQAMVLFPAASRGVITIHEPGQEARIVVAPRPDGDDALDPESLQVEALHSRYLVESARQADGIYIHCNVPALGADPEQPGESTALAISLEGHGGFNALMILENSLDPQALSGISPQTLARFRQHALTAFAKAHLLQALIAKNADLLAAQTQLVEQEKMASLGSLVAGVAHEINTPLGIGVTAASHLKEVAGDLHHWLESRHLKRSDLEAFEGSVREGSQIILRNLERAAKLVKSFKQVAVDQAGEVRREFDLRTTLEELLTSLRPRFKHSRIGIELECPSDILMHSYPGALSQIVSNLVINSLTHAYTAGEEGQIRLRVRALERNVEVHYSDDGCGMDQTVLNRIYEPFFTTRRGDGGSGLGMHIVYNLTTQLLRGTIVCQSEPGQGLQVRFRIPKSIGA